MKSIFNKIGKMLITLMFVIIWGNSRSQTLVMVNVEVTDSAVTDGNYKISGTITNDGPQQFDGEVILLIKAQKGNKKDKIKKNKGTVIIEHSLGNHKIDVNEQIIFEIIRNEIQDSVQLRNIICVWPKNEKNNMGNGGNRTERNIICVWPRCTPPAGARYSNNNDNAIFESLGSKINYTVYPNPLVNITFVSVESGLDQKVTVYVLNNVGQIMKEQVAEVAKGQTFLEIDMNEFGSGVYFFKVCGNGENAETKIVVKN